ncbi:MAG: helix-turn-helix domain-containing protein [Sandaracinobacter sp.]
MSRRVSALLKLRRMTGSRLAQRIGVDRGQVYKWMRGELFVPTYRVLSVADVLGCTPGFLMFGDARPGALASDQELADRLLVARIQMPRCKGDPLVWEGPVP